MLKIFSVKIPVFLLVSLLCGCSAVKNTFFREALEQATNSEVKYGSACMSLQARCREQFYSEWETSDGTLGCSCSKSKYD